MFEQTMDRALAQAAARRLEAMPFNPAAAVRPLPTAPLSALLVAMLDEIDYGMVLVGAGLHVLHANHAARAELDGPDHPLRISGRELAPRGPRDAEALAEALAAARRGLRRMVTLGPEGARASVAVVPVEGAALLVLAKRQMCEKLSVHWFATAHHLTQAEVRVLEGLCAGQRPRAIAEAGGVGLATVRTQVGSIRAKTGAESIRALVGMVAKLPPLVSTLRAMAA